MLNLGCPTIDTAGNTELQSDGTLFYMRWLQKKWCWSSPPFSNRSYQSNSAESNCLFHMLFYKVFDTSLPDTQSGQRHHFLSSSQYYSTHEPVLWTSIPHFCQNALIWLDIIHISMTLILCSKTLKLKPPTLNKNVSLLCTGTGNAKLILKSSQDTPSHGELGG